MSDLIFRNDDVNPSTDFSQLKEMYDFLKTQGQVMSGVNLYGKKNTLGSVYPDVPFKYKPMDYFFDVDSYLDVKGKDLGLIASHGLFHFNHASVSRDYQEASIKMSCKKLSTKLFIPPFNKLNQDTKDICRDSGIMIMSGEKWKSLEFNDFNPDHKYWYFHSWRYSVNQLKEKLNGYSLNVG